MKLKVLSFAVVVALSGHASAFNATGAPNGSGADYRVNISGATATTGTMFEVVTNNLCDPASTISVYEDGSKNWSVACTVLPAFGSDDVLFRKADLGSGFGVTQVDESIPVAVRDMTACTADGTTRTVGSVTVSEYSCTGATVTDVPDIGISDLEPSLFTGTLKAGGVDFKDVTNMIVKPLSGLAFGVVVTTDLRNALQAAQKTPTNNMVVGSDLEKDMPSLSSTQLRSIFTGKVKKWTSLGINDNGTFKDLFAVAAADGTVFVPTDDTVHICRRRAGSGTHAQIASLILGTNCADNTAPMVEATSLSFLEPQVSATQGSSDMGKCLDNIGTGGSTTYTGDNPYSGNRVWGIGYQSTEKNASLSEAYRFVKIDGYAPTLENVHAGRYYDFAQSTLQRRGDNTFNSTITTFGADSDVIAMFDEIANVLGQASQLVSINAGSKFQHDWGQGGWLANPEVAGNTADAILDLSNPVNAVVHSQNNSCQAPLHLSGNKLLVD